MRKFLFFVVSILLFICTDSISAQTGWKYIQDNPVIFCSPGPRTSCTVTPGNIAPTIAGTVWVVQAQWSQPATPVTMSSVTGGGGTWIHCPNCFASNPLGFATDAWYNLTGTAGTFQGITVSLSGSSGSVFGFSFYEVLPPQGSTAAYDDSGIAVPTNCTICTAVQLNNITGTDVIIQNPGGATGSGWNSWSSPYFTDANSAGISLNTTSGAAPTKTFQGVANPEFMAIAFKSTAGVFIPPTQQYSVVNFTFNTGITCSNCVLTIPATGAGHLLFIEAGDEFNSVINSVSGGGTWVVPTGANSCQIGFVILGQNNKASCAYALSSVAGATSITVTMSGNVNTAFAIWEVSTTTGAFVFDTQGSAINNFNAFYSNGPALTLTGANDVVFQMGWVVGGSLGPTYYAMPNIPHQFNSFLNFNVSSVVLTDSGPTAPVPVWINPQNDPTFVSATAFTAVAPTITAVDCNSSSVLAALNSITVDGTKVVIPAGTCTWSSLVTLGSSFSYILQGQTTVAGTCAPGGTCTPTDGTTITLTTGGTAVQINTTAGKFQQITGLTFINTSSTPGFGKINVSGNSTAFRFDHSHFDDQLNGNHMFNIDATYGVFDHNYFDSSNSVDTFFIQPSVNGPDGNANVVWTQPENFGTSSFIFIENNFFQRGWFAYDCDFGARMIFRFNVLGTNTRIQTHAVGSGQERRGCRAIENYQNTSQFSTSPSGNCAWPTVTGSCNSSNFYFPFLVDYESGTGMWWGNTVSGFQTYLREQEIRANNITYTQSATPGGWGYCGTSFNGTGSGWDQNSNTSTGYKCLDQIGAGAGDLLTGSFPNKVNQATGTLAWPRQISIPSYVWASTFNPVPNLSNFFWSTLGGRVTENTDYYLQLPNTNNTATFNGTAGIGQGTLAARPSTCTPFVGYWATDQGTWNQSGSGGQGVFYQCTATNTWTLYYTPYTYPHPLTVNVVSPGNPTVSLSLSSLTFANQLISTTSLSQNSTLTNVGTAALSITSIAVGSNVASWIQSNNCGTVVGVGASCTITVTFAPVVAGLLPSSVNIVSNAPSSPNAITLAGTGIVSIIQGNGSISGNATIKINP